MAHGFVRFVRVYCPVPVSIAVCGLFGALSTIRRVAEYACLPVGANATLMLHVAPTASVLLQVRDVMMNWPGFAPASPIELMFSVVLPLLVSVNVNGALVVRLACVPKL